MAESLLEEDHPHDPLDTMRHSTAHIMAEAVISLFPEAKVGIGPTIEHGFYYDFDLPRPLTTEDMEVIGRADAGHYRRRPVVLVSGHPQGRGVGVVRRPALQAGDHRSD